MVIFKSFISIFFISFFTVSYYYLLGLINNLHQSSKNGYIEPNSIFFQILKGIILVSFFALLIHFFLPLNIYINSFLILTIIILSFFNGNIYLVKKNIDKLLIISFISTLFIIFSNINRPDAALYHLPYVSYLNEQKLVIGLNNIHFRFGVSSIIQYLSAINYNILFGVNGISVPLSILALTIIFYFLEKIISCIKNKNFDLEFFFILFVTIFIAYKMNRYSGYGNDNTTHLLYFLLISILLNSEYKKNFDLICYISIFIFLNKNTYILVFLIPLIYFFKNKIHYNRINFIKKIISPYAVFLYLWLIKNVLISGCIIFPMKSSCFSDLSWSKEQKTVAQISESGEAWSKGWPQYDGDLNIEDFNKKFQWVSAWTKTHAKLILKILLPYILFLILIVCLIRFQKEKDSFLKKNKDLNLIISINLIFVFIFFFKFPLLRYGSSYLITLISLLFISQINKFNINFVNKLTKILFLLIIVVFNLKQIMKIKNNFHREYLNKPWPNIYTLDDKTIYKKDKFINYKNLNIYYSNKECAYSKSICGNYKPQNGLEIIDIGSYYIIKSNN